MIRGLRATVAAVGVLAVLTLTACGGPAAYTDLEGEAISNDVLPPAVVDGWVDLPMNPNSAHYIDEFDERAFYLVGGGLPHLLCLVVYRNDDDWAGTCGARGEDFELDYGGLTITVAPDGSRVLEDGTRIGNNIVLTVQED